MKRIRIGNDINVRWSILTAEGTPYELTGRDIRVFAEVSVKSDMRFMSPHTESQEIEDFTIEGNVIRFTFAGREQERTGVYALCFIENDGEPAMVTFDLRGAFELVPHSWQEGQGDTTTIETENVSLTSRLSEVNPLHPYLSIERLRRYLYKMTFDNLPEDSGMGIQAFGACSSYVENGKLYRNLDFNYDNAASFILRTRNFEAMSFVTGLNDGELNDELIAQLPYRLVDGRNNDGIMVSVHVLFNDWRWSGCGGRIIPLTRLPFLILSRVKSMATIESDLDGVLDNLSSTTGLDAAGYLLQCLVTDGTTTYAVIPPDEDGSSYALVDATSNPKMSNFRYVNRSEVSRYDMDIQARPTGVERFNMMPCSLADLRFTAAYESPDRLSEFIGLRGTSKDSTDEELEAIYNDAHALYLDRQRDGRTWQTMHSVVYGRKMEHLYIQEIFDDDVLD